MAAASPTSAAPLSDTDPPPSSPVPLEKSFMTAALTEDEASKMVSATPEPSDKPRRKRGPKDEAKEQNGNMIGKIRHLKFEDGRPLWRKDIQYDFLRAIFDNKEKVFTNSWEPQRLGQQCFADLYIDTMSRSSKTSKVLRDKLLSDREAAKGMAMVCLLVNVGRMNTTLNFFPEMRAQLRTYHAIPSLQAHQDPHAYKQLQDAPRLKSILKGGAEDRGAQEPSFLEQVKASHVPRTNPVNLLFLICAAAIKVAELHFPPEQEFHDLIIKPNYSSASRARAFLWIMWFYLESDYTEEGCDENPFGPGVDYGLGVANQGVPRLDELTAELEGLENVDTEEEKAFGEEKWRLRRQILEVDQQYLAESQKKRGGNKARGLSAGVEAADHGPSTGILPRIRPSKHESDMDSVRSTPPPRGLAGRNAVSTGRRGGASLKYQIFEGSSPGGGQMMEGMGSRKPRPPTAHQLAVERNRHQRVDYILDRGIRKVHHSARKARRNEGAFLRALDRLQEIRDPFDDSEHDEYVSVVAPGSGQGQLMLLPNGEAKNYPFHERGFGGLCQLRSERDDYGEEFHTFSAALRRASRRLKRWEDYQGAEILGVVAPVRKRKQGSNGFGNVIDDEDMMVLDGYGDLDASPSKEPMTMLVDPAETEDEADMTASVQRMPHKTAVARRRNRSHMSRPPAAKPSDAHGDMSADDGDDLDDVELEILGMAGGDDGDEHQEDADPDQGEEDLSHVDKALLGLDGDTDSE